MTWYKKWFGEDYLKVYPHRDETEAKLQVNFVASTLNLQPGHRILDLGCGNGRHAGELAAKGLDIFCLDLSPVLLADAKEKYAECCIRFVQADMRAIPFHNAFDYVLSFFTTFGYFPTTDENLRTLKSIAAAMKPGGICFQDYMNKHSVIANLVPSDQKQLDGVEIIQERSYNRAKERIEKKISIHENGKKREYFESVRLYTLDEMTDLFAQAGLAITETYGNFDGSAFRESSPRLLIFAEKETS